MNNFMSPCVWVEDAHIAIILRTFFLGRPLTEKIQVTNKLITILDSFSFFGVTFQILAKSTI